MSPQQKGSNVIKLPTLLQKDQIRKIKILNFSFSVVLKFVIFQYYVARQFLSTTSHLCTIRKHGVHWKCECSTNSPPAHL